MKHKSTSLLALLWAATFFIAEAQTPISLPRGRECWVFRSVLDGRPRILTAALHPDLYVAYDAGTGNLFKIWKDGVKLQGPVFNHKHGPQPVSMGAAYANEPGPEPTWQWVLTKNGVNMGYIPAYKGYVLKNNKLVIKIILQTSDKDFISIEESPEFTNLGGNTANPGLIRNITVSGLPENTSLGLIVSVNMLVNKDALTTTGKFTPTNRMENIHSWGSSYGLKGLVTLNANAGTQIITYFNAKAIQ
jgi:cytochrome c